jgi:hypothetical protein
MMFLEYTTQEGGRWRSVATLKTKAQVVDELENSFRRQRRGSESCGLRVENGHTLRIHAVRFPDGHIWDAHLRRRVGNPWQPLSSASGFLANPGPTDPTTSTWPSAPTRPINISDLQALFPSGSTQALWEWINLPPTVLIP